MRTTHLILLLGLSQAILSAAESKSAEPVPLTRAHSHNDYEHKRPLQDALDHGFCSIEADIYLVDGQLLVAHDRVKVHPKKTLQALYLDPLRERVKANGGRVYRNGPGCILLVDVKSQADSTYRALRSVLDRYGDVLTQFEAGNVRTNAITVIISGNRAEKLMASEQHRLAAYDGRLPDLESNIGPDLIPLVSHNWASVFQWRGVGPLPADQKVRLEELVHKAHRQGRRLRFWGAPDTPVVWDEFYRAGVDLLNADDLAGLQRFLLRKQAASPSHG